MVKFPSNRPHLLPPANRDVVKFGVVGGPFVIGVQEWLQTVSCR